jgi:hypothetical protein
MNPRWTKSVALCAALNDVVAFTDESMRTV